MTASLKHCDGSTIGRMNVKWAIGVMEYGKLVASREARPRNPRLAQSQFLRGVQLFQSGQIAAAAPILLTAIQADDKHFEAHHALGSALAQIGRFAEASAILARAVALSLSISRRHCVSRPTAGVVTGSASTCLRRRVLLSRSGGWAIAGAAPGDTIGPT